MKTLLMLSAAAFYLCLTVYIATELYYNRTYWRIILRKKRASRWEYLLWVERALLFLFGILTILIPIYLM